MSKYTAILFDFDGTIYNTFRGIALSMQYTLRERYSQLHEPEDFIPCIGPPMEWSMKEMFGVPENEIPDALAMYRSHYGEICIEASDLYDGAKDMLERLHAAGIKLAVASSKPTYMIEKIMAKDGIEPLFECICGITGTGDKTTKTDVILRAVEALGASKDEVLMVGDRKYDAEGAQNAGVDFCAAMYGGFAAQGEFDEYPSVCRAEDTGAVADFALNERCF